MLCDRNASYSCLSGLAPEGDEDELVPRRSASYSKFRHTGDLIYESQNLDVPVVVVASEVEPWSKSGGLAIVAGAYGYEFAMRGHRTMVVAPMYEDYEGATWLADKDIFFFGGNHRVKFYYQKKVHDAKSGAATDYVFVHLDCFRRAGGFYHDTNGEYGDNLFRFGLFAMAALEAPLCLNIGGSTYGDKVLFMANDWQAGLLPVYLAHKFRPHGTYASARCIFVVGSLDRLRTSMSMLLPFFQHVLASRKALNDRASLTLEVHNMGYQGTYPWSEDFLSNLCLPESVWSSASVVS
ncbi:unnamed protein product [Polarella glacialis]|uniref:Starch synthase catalytic domain-containing protein n=1 Tax=Polarella glacialis TaxID=89957 RepID=A0A813GGW5_POLGL|nr:unnamed protein product [Polarella glacialis]